MLSHRAVLDSALTDGVESILVLEDDACPVPDFSRLANRFLADVPADWDGLMFGAQHLMPPRSVGAGVVQCTTANRMHAYALRSRLMGVFAKFLSQATNDHCDILLAALMGHFKVYAPDPLLIGQDAGPSDITGRLEPLRFLCPAHKLALRVKRPIAQIESEVIRSTTTRTAAA